MWLWESSVIDRVDVNVVQFLFSFIFVHGNVQGEEQPTVFSAIDFVLEQENGVECNNGFKGINWWWFLARVSQHMCIVFNVPLFMFL